MRERWRKPVLIDSCEVSAEVVLLGDRLVAEELVILADPSDMERIREGYVCPNCFEPFENPFPVACNVCAYPVRAEAATHLDHHYKGKVWVGSHISIDDELEELAEKNERAMFKPGSSILLPRGLND